MSISTPEKPTFIDCTEISITLEFKAQSEAAYYELSWKQHGQNWDDATKLRIGATSDDTITAEAADLLPATPYYLRVTAIDSSGFQSDPSPELIVDTEGVSCAPKSKSCCVIQ
mmetsp:Transcript_12561/g.18317  ORF Transcript_12561/g.18317 Transcript_12561/m.18317 type:complete len:113 (-) Transcript_12561:221-559(-)|eukprot:CAMPEP_0197240866 /NCGR_PEP_ID=MMETSP1429-20130617/7065_1 /TAXON_ID=49237 /ORGANISM="Chaetoceros  sp., Strain UNC1202" /LENGTH=112 /DNA_ID=CAMNT_0042700599 /DNA_START=47 /DNA_END=385 /DNA_ORIENTATION=+